MPSLPRTLRASFALVVLRFSKAKKKKKKKKEIFLFFKPIEIVARTRSRDYSHRAKNITASKFTDAEAQQLAAQVKRPSGRFQTQTNQFVSSFAFFFFFFFFKIKGQSMG
jgi:hypothetical protein